MQPFKQAFQPVRHKSAQLCPVDALSQAFQSVANSLPQTVPVEILNKCVQKVQRRVQSVAQGAANQPPVQRLRKAVQRVRNIQRPFVCGITDFSPWHLVHGVVQLFGKYRTDFIPVIVFDCLHQLVRKRRAFYRCSKIGANPGSAATTAAAVFAAVVAHLVQDVKIHGFPLCFFGFLCRLFGCSGAAGCCAGLLAVGCCTFLRRACGCAKQCRHYLRNHPGQACQCCRYRPHHGQNGLPQWGKGR